MFYLYLFCTLLARCVLRCLLTHCRPFRLRKDFIAMLYFQMGLGVGLYFKSTVGKTLPKGKVWYYLPGLSISLNDSLSKILPSGFSLKTGLPCSDSNGTGRGRRAMCIFKGLPSIGNVCEPRLTHLSQPVLLRSTVGERR